MCGCPAQTLRMSTSFIVDLRSSSSSSSTANDAGSSSQCSPSVISKIFTAYCRPVDFSMHRRTVLLTPLNISQSINQSIRTTIEYYMEYMCSAHTLYTQAAIIMDISAIQHELKLISSLNHQFLVAMAIFADAIKFIILTNVNVDVNEFIQPRS